MPTADPPMPIAMPSTPSVALIAAATPHASSAFGARLVSTFGGVYLAPCRIRIRSESKVSPFPTGLRTAPAPSP